jgi:hypothetical protein
VTKFKTVIGKVFLRKGWVNLNLKSGKRVKREGKNVKKEVLNGEGISHKGKTVSLPHI